MKFILSFVCLLVAVCIHAKPTPEEMEKIKAAMEVCKPKTGATDADIEVLSKHEIPESKTGQCFVACMNKEFGIMTSDGKFDVNNIKEMAAPLKEKDAAKYEQAMKVLETCAAEANALSDECEMAKKMMECTKKEADAKGIVTGAAATR